MPGFNRNSGGSGGYSGGYKGGNSYGTKRPWDRGTQSQNGFDDRPKFKATCASCGNACEVPFKPNGSKPVYCRDCFKKEGNGGETRSFERRTDDRGFNMEEKRLYKTECAKCGDACEVPFRPTGERPVYCRPCFGKSEQPERNDRFERKSAPEFRGGSDNSAEQFRILNSKLDAILKALNPAPAKAPEIKAEVKVEAKKAEAPKATAKKKAAAKKKK